MKLYRPYLTDIESNLFPDASGALDIGSVSLAFNEAYIDKVYLEADPTTPFQAATKQYVDNAVEGENLWNRSGTDLVPTNAGDNVVTTGYGDFDHLFLAEYIAHTGDTDNFIQFGTDTQIFYTGNTQRLNISNTEVVVNETGAVTDFRVETNTVTDAFVVDGSADAVTFGVPVELGNIEIEEDSGVVTLVDMSVSASPAAGTEESYIFALDATPILTIYSEADSAGGIQQAGLKLENGAMIANKQNTDIDTGTETVDSFPDTYGDAAQWTYVVKSGVNLRAGTIVACWEAAGDTTEYSETHTEDIGDTSDVTFAVDISSDDVRLRATTTSDNWEVRTVRTLI